MNLAIVQARLGSARFPRKVLQPFWRDKTVLEFLIERLKLSKQIDKIIVATTNELEDLELVEVCNKIGIECFNLGTKDSALESVYQAYKRVCGDMIIDIIDITADCVLIDPCLIDYLINIYNKHDYNYFSNVVTRSFPIGFDTQIYRDYLLESIYNIVTNPNHRVHVGWNIMNYWQELTENIYSNLKMGNYSAKDKYFQPSWRIVLDYPEDLILLKEIVNHFDRIDFTYQEIMDYLYSRPELLEINKNCKQKIAGEDK